MVLMLVVGLWLTPFLLNRLGQHDYGLWLIITQLSAYLGLLDLGIIGLLPRETAYAVGRGGVQSAELPKLLGQTIHIVLRQLPIVAICAVVAYGVGRSTVRSAEVALEVILAAFVVTFPLRLFAATLQGLQDLAFVARAQMVAWSISTALSVYLVFQGVGLMALAIAWALNQVATAIICYLRLRISFPGVLPHALPPLDRGDAGRHLKKGVWMSVNQVAQLLVTGSDLVLIGKLLGPAATVPYSVTGKLSGVLANKPQMLMQTAFPALSELKGTGSRDRIRQATVALSQAMLTLSGGVACVVLAVNRSFVSWWIAPDQFGGGLLTGLIVTAMVMRHWNSTFAYSVFCFGHERRLALTGIADGCLSFLSGAILIHFVGPIGAPLGLMMGTCFVNMPLNLAALSREFSATPFELLGTSGAWLFRFVLVAIAGWVTGVLWDPKGFLGIAGLGLLVGAAYLGTMASILRRDPLGAYLRPRLESVAIFFQRRFPVFAK